MFHIGAFGFTSSNTGAGVFVTVPAKTDQYLTVNANSRFILPPVPNPGSGGWRIIGGYAMGTTMTVARVNNATLRRIGLPSIVPIQPALVIPSLINIAFTPTNGPKLPVADEFGVEADAAAAEVQTAALWIHDGVMNVPVGERFCLQFSSTITTVANTWTPGSFTFAQTLPTGRYAVIGGDLMGTTAIFWRLVFPNGGPRPGGLGRASNTIFPSNQFRNGELGAWGEFTSYAQPQIEVFASSAAAIVFTGFLDVVYLGQ